WHLHRSSGDSNIVAAETAGAQARCNPPAAFHRGLPRFQRTLIIPAPLLNLSGHSEVSILEPCGAGSPFLPPHFDSTCVSALVTDRAMEAWYHRLLHERPPSGGSHGKPHRTTKILSHAVWRRGGLAARGGRAAADDAGGRVSQPGIARPIRAPRRGVPARLGRGWLCRASQCRHRLQLGQPARCISVPVCASHCDSCDSRACWAFSFDFPTICHLFRSYRCVLRGANAPCATSSSARSSAIFRLSRAGRGPWR